MLGVWGNFGFQLPARSQKDFRVKMEWSVFNLFAKLGNKLRLTRNGFHRRVWTPQSSFVLVTSKVSGVITIFASFSMVSFFLWSLTFRCALAIYVALSILMTKCNQNLCWNFFCRLRCRRFVVEFHSIKEKTTTSAYLVNVGSFFWNNRFIFQSQEFGVLTFMCQQLPWYDITIDC